MTAVRKIKVTVAKVRCPAGTKKKNLNEEGRHIEKTDTKKQTKTGIYPTQDPKTGVWPRCDPR